MSKVSLGGGGDSAGRRISGDFVVPEESEGSSRRRKPAGGDRLRGLASKVSFSALGANAGRQAGR